MILCRNQIQIKKAKKSQESNVGKLLSEDLEKKEVFKEVVSKYQKQEITIN